MNKKMVALLKSVIAVVFAGLMFIPLALAYFTTKGNVLGSEGTVKFGDLADAIELGETVKNENIGLLNFSRILYIIAIVVAAIILLLAVVKIFANIKVLNLVTVIAGFAEIVLAIGAFVLALAYCAAETTKLLTYNVAIGPWLILVFGLITGIAAFVVANAKKGKK